jgi:hypothetical protein
MLPAADLLVGPMLKTDHIMTLPLRKMAVTVRTVNSMGSLHV